MNCKRPLNGAILIAAISASVVSGVAAAPAQEPDCEPVKLGAVRADMSFGGMGYQRFGDIFIWKKSSQGREKCDKSKQPDEQELIALFKKHDGWADDLKESESVSYRYGKLNVADDVTIDIRAILSRENISYQPHAIVFVSRLEYGASFFLECFAGRREGLMNVDPSEL